ncbi:hypothetical protein BDR06DRAFT_997049 [Suillus hirtellus]|nr:hypothetical protein BDR06DRAFT_997049 [Suillus hirtellus]
MMLLSRGMRWSPQKRLLPHTRYALATGPSKPVEPVKYAVRQRDMWRQPLPPLTHTHRVPPSVAEVKKAGRRSSNLPLSVQDSRLYGLGDFLKIRKTPSGACEWHSGREKKKRRECLFDSTHTYMLFFWGKEWRWDGPGGTEDGLEWGIQLAAHEERERGNGYEQTGKDGYKERGDSENTAYKLYQYGV